ncbi:MAG: tetratricopeptide repeat protein [Planctomycetota bacterium]
MLLALAACAEVRPPRPEHAIVPPARNLFDQGVLLRDSGDGLLALHKFEAAVAVSPAFVEAHRALQNLYLARYQRGLMLERYTRFLEEDPAQAYRWYLLGRLASSPERQLACFEAALRCDANSFWPHLGLGWSWRALGQEARSEQQYRRALELYPGSPYALQGLIEVLTANGQYGEAQRVLDVYQELRQGDRDAARLQMQLDVAAGHPREAVHLAFAFLELDDVRAEEIDIVSDILLKAAGDAEQQYAYSLLAPKAGQGKPELDRLFGELAMRQGDLRGALMSLKLARAELPPCELQRDIRYLLVATGRFSEALELARAAFPPSAGRLEGRWQRALVAAQEAEERRVPSRKLKLARALADLGWIKESLTVVNDVIDAQYQTHEAWSLRRELERHRLFEDRMSEYFRKLYEDFSNTGADRDLDTVLNDLHDLSLRTLQRNVVDPVVVKDFAPIGSIVDPDPKSGSGLAHYFDRFNRFFLLGRRAGGPAEAILLNRLSSDDLPRPGEAPASVIYVEGLRIPSYLQYRGGAIAGAAFGTFVFLDLDPIRRDVEAAVQLFQRFGTNALDHARRAGAHARGAPRCARAARHRRQVPVPLVPAGGAQDRSRSEYLRTTIDSVLQHEQTHLDDAERFCPSPRTSSASCGSCSARGSR